ncbi:hypothetical protein Cgig2_015435 [Carnegiea gigantea]|uniref:Uncharacterized protein n=1 Tax=Carnegiea gigantea TaxID=171969 RepID=A0A9Q1JY10_9CARY|nr:hypothetical protein Cgig2_015435 [Carnegiea gigantea]
MLSEKRKALEAQKAEERKVTVDRELEGMQLVKKKEDDSIVKLKSEEKLKKKDNLEKEKARKSAPADIAGFLKPASYRSGGREFGGGSDGGFRRQQFSSSRGGQTNDGRREQYIGDEASARGRYSSRGYDQGGSRGGNSYRGVRTSNAGREQSRGGRGGSTEVGSRGLNSAQGGQANDDVGQKEEKAAADVNPYDQDFPVLGAKPSSVPAAASTTVKA